jgi:hypothetical protein
MQGSQRCATETATIINLLVPALNTPSLVASSRRTPKAFATLIKGTPIKLLVSIRGALAT